jgi:serine/threonine protein kinase
LIGRTLGNYEITAELGRGGMGEVYRARDTRLNREVAIKVLPAHIAGDPDVQERFSREAKTVSNLNHPNICVLHDVGEEDGVHFLVMELVDGITLTQALRKGPLPIADTLRYGEQLSDALDSAHRAGVIHRDLKPGNVMISKQGAKLMDFGLARATAASQAPDATVALSQEPLTAEGAIVGTFQYMAPEQLEGQEVDQRADLWALGCVLYEMATGARAFEGATQASLIGSIMHAQPAPVSEQVDLSPPEFDRLVSACLAKDPDDRVQSAHDLKLQLGWLAEGPSSSSAATPVPPIRRKTSRWPLVVLLALAVGAVGAVGAWLVKPGSETKSEMVQRFELGKWSLTFASTPRISPDGEGVVFSVQSGTERMIYRRDFGALEARPIPGTEGGTGPFFSPDGRWLGFVTRAGIERVPVDGGVAQRIVAVPGINSADWGDDGMVYLALGGGGVPGDVALYRVSGDGGELEVFARLEGNEGLTWLPEVLPGSQAVLVTILGSGSKLIAFTQDGERKVLLDDVFEGRYADPGYLFYRDQENEATTVVPFDAQTLEMQGSAVSMTEPIHANFCFDVSSNGMLVYVPAPSAQEKSELRWQFRDGTSRGITEVQSSWAQPRISPDGTQIVVRETGATCDLWVFDLERGSLSRLNTGDDSHNPVWSPDSRRVLYDGADSGNLTLIGVGGGRSREILVSGVDRGEPSSWGAAGNLLAYTVTGPVGEPDIWVRHLDTGEAELFFGSAEAEFEPNISPDGRWIAYTSEETGTLEVYVRAYPADGSAWQVSVAGGGRSPLWSRDGKELYFIRVSDNSLMASTMQTQGRTTFEVPVELLERFGGNRSMREYDVAADGSFVVVSGQSADNEFKVRAVLNWPRLVAELTGRSQ